MRFLLDLAVFAIISYRFNHFYWFNWNKCFIKLVQFKNRFQDEGFLFKINEKKNQWVESPFHPLVSQLNFINSLIVIYAEIPIKSIIILITNKITKKKNLFFHPTFDLELFWCEEVDFCCCQSRVYHFAKYFSITKKRNKKFYDLMKICLELKTCGGWDENRDL